MTKTAQERRSDTKTCNLCGEEKPETEFLKWFSGDRKRYRRSPYCHVCRAVKVFDSTLKTKYGISREDYNRLLYYQDDKCPICGVDLFDRVKKCVDHCHDTGVVRGILCNRCNILLGHANDNVDILNKAISYLTI